MNAFRFFFSMLLLYWTTLSHAACTGSSPNWSSTADNTSVSTCISNAVSGDTITVTAGSATWSGKLSVGLKSLTIVGAGAGSTVITSGGFTLGADCTTATNTTDISGFTFLSNGDTTFLVYGAQGWRFHDNAVTYPSAQTALYFIGCGGTRGVEGLIDNNTLTYARAVYYGETSTADNGNSRWAETLEWGSGHYLFEEDNTIVWTNGSSGSYLNHLDGNWGCRYTARFNTIQNGRFEAHALQAFEERGCRSWEIYNNTLTNTGDPSYREWLMRGGTGVIFHNTSDQGAVNDGVHIDNPRTHQDAIIASMGSWGACDDTPDSPQVDEQSSGGEGYLCRDQIGSSTDAFEWDFGSSVPAQDKQPAYIFRNTYPGPTEIPVVLNCVGDATQCTRQSAKHLVVHRDYYVYDAGFDGTSGIGEGVLASRPATCTTGVAYWVTDQGEWNSLHAGADGRLDVCTSTNTWTAGYYMPYTYPHPLRGVAASTTILQGGACSGCRFP